MLNNNIYIQILLKYLKIIIKNISFKMEWRTREPMEDYRMNKKNKNYKYLEYIYNYIDNYIYESFYYLIIWYIQFIIMIIIMIWNENTILLLKTSFIHITNQYHPKILKKIKKK